MTDKKYKAPGRARRSPGRRLSSRDHGRRSPDTPDAPGKASQPARTRDQAADSRHSHRQDIYARDACHTDKADVAVRGRQPERTRDQGRDGRNTNRPDVIRSSSPAERSRESIRSSRTSDKPDAFDRRRSTAGEPSSRRPSDSPSAHDRQDNHRLDAPDNHRSLDNSHRAGRDTRSSLKSDRSDAESNHKTGRDTSSSHRSDKKDAESSHRPDRADTQHSHRSDRPDTLKDKPDATWRGRPDSQRHTNDGSAAATGQGRPMDTYARGNVADKARDYERGDKGKQDAKQLRPESREQSRPFRGVNFGHDSTAFQRQRPYPTPPMPPHGMRNGALQWHEQRCVATMRQRTLNNFMDKPSHN